METINIAGAVAGGLIAFLLGAVWYSPLMFGTIWAKHCGLTQEQLAAADTRKMFFMALPLALLAALAFAAFLGEANLSLAIPAGFTAGLFWVAGSLGINYVYEQRPLALLLVNGGYHTAQFTLYGLCIGAANQFF